MVVLRCVAAMCTGNGTKKPVGIFTADGGEVGVTTAAADKITADEIIDLIYSLPDGGGKALIERVETRHGLRQLSYMKELGIKIGIREGRKRAKHEQQNSVPVHN